MAKSCFTTPIQASNRLHHSKTHVFTTYIQLIFHISLCNSLYTLMQYLLNLQIQTIIFLQMTQTLQILCILITIVNNNNFRQFNLLNVKPSTEAPSNIQHAKVKARVHVRVEAERIKAFKCEAYAKKERKIYFQGSVKYRRVDRTVWNQYTLPYLITLDPINCKKNLLDTLMVQIIKD